MSVHLVVDIAFCVGLAFSIKPGISIVKKFIYNRRKEIDSSIKQSLLLKSNAESLLKQLVLQNYNIENELNDIKNHTINKSILIMENGIKEIEQIFYKHLSLIEEQINRDIEFAQQQLVNEAIVLAAEIIKHLAKESEFQHIRTANTTFNL